MCRRWVRRAQSERLPNSLLGKRLADNAVAAAIKVVNIFADKIHAGLKSSLGLSLRIKVAAVMRVLGTGHAAGG